MLFSPQIDILGVVVCVSMLATLIFPLRHRAFERSGMLQWWTALVCGLISGAAFVLDLFHLMPGA